MPDGWEFTPTPTWTLRLAGDVSVDLTPWVLDWDVTYGTRWVPASGAWSLQTASGSLTLDAAGGGIVAGAADPLIPLSAVSTPQAVLLSLGPGGETLWQGVAVVRLPAGLTPAETVTWELRSRMWQVLRGPLLWRQRDNSATGSTPREVCRRVLRDAVGATDSDPSLDLLSPASVWPTGLRLRDVTLAESGGSAWNRLAHTLGCIPFEDSQGRLGMAAVQGVGQGRQTGVPAGQMPLRGSELVTIGTPQLWQLDVVSRNFHFGAEAETLITTGEAGNTIGVSVSYPYPADTIGVEWSDPQPTANAGWSIVGFTATPAPDRSRADILRCVLRRDDDSAQPSGVKFIGWRLTVAGSDVVNTVDGGLPDSIDPQRLRTQTTGPWIDHTDSAFSLDAHAKAIAFANELKVQGRLILPLWSRDETSRVIGHVDGRTGQLVPGSVSRYRADATATVDLITGLVGLAGAAEQVPSATVTGWTASGAGTAAEPVVTGIDLPDLPDGVPTPWTVPGQAHPIPSGPQPAGPELRAVVTMGLWAVADRQVARITEPAAAGPLAVTRLGPSGSAHGIASLLGRGDGSVWALDYDTAAAGSAVWFATVSDSGAVTRVGSAARHVAAWTTAQRIGLPDVIWAIIWDPDGSAWRLASVADSGEVRWAGAGTLTFGASPTVLASQPRTAAMWTVDTAAAAGDGPAAVRISTISGTQRTLAGTRSAALGGLVWADGALWAIDQPDQPALVAIDIADGRLRRLATPRSTRTWRTLAASADRLFVAAAARTVLELSPVDGDVVRASLLRGIRRMSLLTGRPPPPVPAAGPTLATLQVAGGTLVPPFDPAIGRYDVHVADVHVDVQITVTATSTDGTITGDGTIAVPVAAAPAVAVTVTGAAVEAVTRLQVVRI